MAKKTEEEILQTLERINWDFEDYNSSKYPLDLNSIPWYPATFPAPIPKYLVALLSDSEDVVFDPFGGKGTTAIETLKQRRKFIYNDLNPHAVQIMKCLLDAIRQPGDETELYSLVEADKRHFFWQNNNEDYPSYKGKDEESILKKLPKDIFSQLTDRGIKRDVIYWYHAETLKELICLFDYIAQCRNREFEMGVRKLAFLSILKVLSSQRGHFSYVTDNCKPAEMKYYNAIRTYLETIDRIQRACVDFKRQYKVINKTDDLQRFSQQCTIRLGDAKECAFIPDNSVDLIITSPPYLCAQDYILTMRLNDFFFPDNGFGNLPFCEIGPRRLRTRAGIADAYFSDMNLVIKELFRVMKDDAYFCLIIGQGKGKVSEHVNVIKNLSDNAEKIGFFKVFERVRNIIYRANRVGGVDKENLILFRK